MSEILKYYRREFINPEQVHSHAHILAEIRYHPVTTYRRSPYIEGGFAIMDCSRVASLDFYSHDKKDIDNGLYKLDKLISALTEYRNVFAELRSEFPDDIEDEEEDGMP
jgi:hypothetical protein